MNKVMQFEKVSFEQYFKDFIDRFKMGDTVNNRNKVKEIYDRIKLPCRATAGSAGYDFYIPFDFPITYDPEVIPTGIRCKIEPGWCLKIYPRSGLGFKYGMRLENTVGIIDEDYYFANNEGHIMVKIRSERDFTLKNGDRMCQGIAEMYGIAYDDEPLESERLGGFGSTGN